MSFDISLPIGEYYYINPDPQVIETEEGYDIYDKFIYSIIDKWEFVDKYYFVLMYAQHPKLPEGNWLFEMFGYEGGCPGDTVYWDNDWCEGETLITVYAIYTFDALEQMAKDHYHAHRGKEHGTKSII